MKNLKNLQRSSLGFFRVEILQNFIPFSSIEFIWKFWANPKNIRIILDAELPKYIWKIIASQAGGEACLSVTPLELSLILWLKKIKSLNVTSFGLSENPSFFKTKILLVIYCPGAWALKRAHKSPRDRRSWARGILWAFLRVPTRGPLTIL